MKSVYYVSSGRQNKMFTLRHRFEERMWRNIGNGKYDSYIVERDWYMMNLANDKERALEKITQIEKDLNITINKDFDIPLFEITRNGSIDTDPYVFAFGKYERDSIYDVNEYDHSYVLWYYKQIEYKFGAKTISTDHQSAVRELVYDDLVIEEKERVKLESEREIQKEKNEFIVDVLKYQRGNFIRSMIEKLERGDKPSEFSFKMLAIMKDCYGKDFGRRNSKKYNEATEDFEDWMENND